MDKTRNEFHVLIDRCGCSRKSILGVCTPKLCFPHIYNLIYPKGGFHLKGRRFTSNRSVLNKITEEKRKSLGAI